MRNVKLDLSNCTKAKNGDIWCYDREAKSVYQVFLKKPVITTIPQEVLLDLLQVEEDRKKSLLEIMGGE